MRGKPDIEQDEVDVVGQSAFQAIRAVIDDHGRVAGGFESAADERRDARFVLYDEGSSSSGCLPLQHDVARAHRRGQLGGPRRGRLIVKVAPPPGVSVTMHCPPWPFAIASTIARPSPDPPTVRLP